MSRLVVLDLNVYCWLTEAVSAHFIYMDCTILWGSSGRELPVMTHTEQITPTWMEETFFFLDIYWCTFLQFLLIKSLV